MNGTRSSPFSSAARLGSAPVPVAIAATILGALAVGAESVLALALAGGGGRLWAPLPVGILLPAWRIGASLTGSVDAGNRLIPAFGCALFLALGFPLAIPRSKLLAPALAVAGLMPPLSIAYFVAGWHDGVAYQGLAFTASVAVVNAAWAVLVLGLGVRAVRLRTYWSRYAFTFLLCIWIVGCAFPWLGEVP